MTTKLSQLIFKFKPIYKNVTWGGTQIATFKGEKPQGSNVGESWEISGVKGHESLVSEGPLTGQSLSQLIATYGADIVGEQSLQDNGNDFPLLVKFINAHDNLSVQVHPNDKLAKERHGCSGKSEMWYIIDTKKDAQIYLGLNKPLTPEEYDDRVANKTILDVISQHTTKAGNTYYLPAGRVHSIGAGNLLLEVQQASDITYRIFDFDRRDASGNPRELHTQLAKDAIDYSVHDDYNNKVSKIDDTHDRLVKCRYFDVKKINVDGVLKEKSDGTFTVMVCINGDVTIKAKNNEITDSTEIRQGQTILVAAAAEEIELEGKGVIITATI